MANEIEGLFSPRFIGNTLEKLGTAQSGVAAVVVTALHEAQALEADFARLRTRAIELQDRVAVLEVQLASRDAELAALTTK
jgi:hypothetical protein